MEFDAGNLLMRANAGDADAQYELAARLRENGYGFPVDLQQSDKWLKLAAEGGNATAQAQYAINLRATKLPANERASLTWFRRAADQGDSRARFGLGLNLFLGIGTPVDRVKAASLIVMASLNGHSEARQLITDVLANELSREEWGATIQSLLHSCPRMGKTELRHVLGNDSVALTLTAALPESARSHRRGRRDRVAGRATPWRSRPVSPER